MGQESACQGDHKFAPPNQNTSKTNNQTNESATITKLQLPKDSDKLKINPLDMDVFGHVISIGNLEKYIERDC